MNDIFVYGGHFIQKSKFSRLDRVFGVNTKTKEPVEIIRPDNSPNCISNHSNLPPMMFREDGEPLLDVVKWSIPL